MSELGPEAREILRNGRDGDDPSPADRTRIRGALLAAIAAGAVETASQSAYAAAIKTSETIGTTATVSAAKPVAVSLLGSVLAKGIFVAIVSAVGIGAMIAWPHAISNTVPATPNAIETPAVAGLPATEPPPRAPAALDDSSTKVEHPPAVITAAPLPQKTSPPRTTAPAPPPRVQEETVDSLITETQRLRNAHGALQGGDPEKALALLSDQAAETEGQKLREERAAARVLALCKLGRVDEANAEAAVFLERNPNSPLAARVRKACPTTR